MARRGVQATDTVMKGDYVETTENREARLIFEDSHPFRNGDLVIVLDGPAAFKGDIAKVVRTRTSSITGGCIAYNYGGVTLNSYDPNAELCFATKIAILLYQ